ncbi:MAG: glycosyltransferase family 39 protein, partial [Candidatus Binataceae bacterium]
SWLYAHAVRALIRTGGFHFGGYTQAMPVAQVVYGAAWAKLFGQSSPSFDLSVAVLGALGAIMFYALARRCGAAITDAAIATALLAANPCYLFLSFSFMTEIPFMVLFISAFLAFARAVEEDSNAWRWLAGLLAFAGFMVRPFAGVAIIGCAAVLLIYDLHPWRLERAWLRRGAHLLAPFAVAALLCVLEWTWVTRLNGQPWKLARSEHQLRYIFYLPAAAYARDGVLAPLLYLGVVLSPLALMGLAGLRWHRAVLFATAVLVAAWILMRLSPGWPTAPEFSCCGGWRNALLLRGLSTRFFWAGRGQWPATVLGSFGAVGIVVAAATVSSRLDRAAAAMMVAAGCYWAATIPLWFFNDRYYLVMLPAGCLLLAISGFAQRPLRAACAIAMAAVLAGVSIGTLCQYQSGLRAVVAAFDELERSGVPRSEIDAGYALNGRDLYPSGTEDAARQEAGIPMITSHALSRYTIAIAPVPGTEVVRRLPFTGPFGLVPGEIYVLRKLAPIPTRPVSQPPASGESRGSE